MASTTGAHDEVAGNVHQVKGGIKETIGRITNNPDLEDEGTAEKVDGIVETKVGQVKKIFEK